MYASLIEGKRRGILKLVLYLICDCIVYIWLLYLKIHNECDVHKKNVEIRESQT